MPDGSALTALAPAAAPQQKRFRARWVSPLLRRILLVNALPLALLVAALLYLDQYQNGLLEAEVSALREQARIYAGALGESAVRPTDPDNPKLAVDIPQMVLVPSPGPCVVHQIITRAHPLLHRVPRFAGQFLSHEQHEQG